MTDFQWLDYMSETELPVPMGAERRVRFLQQFLRWLNWQHHQLDFSFVPDALYDRLLRELQELEAATGLVAPESPTQTVGSGGDEPPCPPPFDRPHWRGVDEHHPIWFQG